MSSVRVLPTWRMRFALPLDCHHYSTNISCCLLAEYTNIQCFSCAELALDISAILCYNKDNGKGGAFCGNPL